MLRDVHACPSINHEGEHRFATAGRSSRYNLAVCVLNGDDFTFHDAENGRVLGAGDTKEDARTESQIRLHQHFDFGIPLPRVPGRFRHADLSPLS